MGLKSCLNQSTQHMHSSTTHNGLCPEPLVLEPQRRNLLLELQHLLGLAHALGWTVRHSRRVVVVANDRFAPSTGQCVWESN